MAGDANKTMFTPSAGGGVGTAGDSRVHSSNDSIAIDHAGQAVEKICCVCGANVAGKKRMKDADGTYWCYECGMADTVRKHPDQGVECIECHQKFPPSQIVEFLDKKVCQPCEGKLRQAKKREDARIAAAAEEARREAARKKQILIGVAVVAVIAILWILASLSSTT